MSFDLGQNAAGHVALIMKIGIAVESIRVVEHDGPRGYPDARQLADTADSGAARVAKACGNWSCQNWPMNGLDISVLPIPPGTSKWNRDRASSVSSSRRTGVANRW